MDQVVGVFRSALVLMAPNGGPLGEIIGLSLQVSLGAVLCAAMVGFPLGAALAVLPVPGRRMWVILLNGLMGLPPVVVGLGVYLLLSRSGPLGQWGWLFTPKAMVFAQWILVTPIVAALSRQVIEEMWLEYREALQSLGASRWRAMRTLLWEARFSLVTAFLAGFGRASAEVGAVLIVGGNIAHHTRVMTTAIALETSKGDLELALGLGLVLICLTLGVNLGAFLVNEYARLRWG